MTEKPISLNQRRKARDRADAKRQADANAVKFGRSKAERGRDEAENTRAVDFLEAHRKAPDPDP